MTWDDEYWAVRSTVGLLRADHARCVRVHGPGAFDVLDAECAADLYLRDGRMCHTLMLSESAIPFADVYVCRDDEDFLLLFEGPPADAVADRLRRRAVTDRHSIDIDDLTSDGAALQLDGPFAWELAGELLQADVSNMPYLSFMHVDGGLCFRAGKTGEYGYVLVLSADRADAARSLLLDAGTRYGMAETSVATLDLCALENGFFSMRHARPAEATPIELQQQWRVSYRKEYTGAAALRQRLERGVAQRSCAITCVEELSGGDAIRLGEQAIGRIYEAGFSPARGEWIADAVIDVAYAYPHVDRYVADRDGRAVPVVTRPRPLLHNLSLAVDPRVHTHRSRGEIDAPLAPARPR